jgi:hypothetical protein
MVHADFVRLSQDCHDAIELMLGDNSAQYFTYVTERLFCVFLNLAGDSDPHWCFID